MKIAPRLLCPGLLGLAAITPSQPGAAVSAEHERALEVDQEHQKPGGMPHKK